MRRQRKRSKQRKKRRGDTRQDEEEEQGEEAGNDRRDSGHCCGLLAAACVSPQCAFLPCRCCLLPFSPPVLVRVLCGLVSASCFHFPSLPFRCRPLSALPKRKCEGIWSGQTRSEGRRNRLAA